MSEWGPDRFLLDGLDALVVGASRGIGRSTAVAMASAGAEVTLTSRDRAGLEQTSAEIEECGGRAAVAPCDVTSDEQLDELFASLSSVDVLVFGAGMNSPGPMIETSPATLDQMLRLNLRAAFCTAQRAVGRMIAAGRGGSVIFISSQMGHVGALDRTVYCATKHGLEGLAKAMAVELAPFEIRVNTVAPTFIETAMTASFFEDPEFREDVLRRIPLGRLGTPEEVADAVVFAASPASKFVTGSSIVVDGGWTAQ